MNTDTSDPIRQRCDGCGLPPFSTQTIEDTSDATDGGVVHTKLLPLRRCSRCQKAWYHNLECQKRHYPIHKKSCHQQQEQQQQNHVDDSINQQGTHNAAAPTVVGNVKDKGTLVPTCCKEKANEQAEKQRQVLFFVQDRPGRGKCMIASQNIHSGCPISSYCSTTAVGATNNDDGDCDKNDSDDFFPAIVPPVLSESERPNHCAVCFARCLANQSSSPSNSSSSSGSSSSLVLCNDIRFPVLVCTPECYKAHQSWLDAEVATVKSCLSSSNKTSITDSSGRVGVVPPPLLLPKILPTALLVYRICLALIHESVAWKDIQYMACHTTSMNKPPASDDDDDDDDDDGAQAAHQQAVFVTVATLLTTNINTSWKHDSHKQQVAQRVASKYVADILARVKVNAFSICTGDNDNNNDSAAASDDAIGVGIFRTSHYMNHSCDPNARQTFRLGGGNNEKNVVGKLLPQLWIHASRDIYAGEEITISYINHNEQSRTRRRQELLRSYHFHCTCPICGN